MNNDFKVLIADDAIQPQGIELLKQKTLLSQLPAYTSETDLINAVQDVDGILARACVISRPVIEAARKLKVISRHGVGFDNVDVCACTRHGVAVAITEEANSEAVSEQAFASMLALATGITSANSDVHAGNWDRNRFVGVEMHGRVLGVFGFGRIGSRTVRHAAAFDMEVLVCDPYIAKDRLSTPNATLVDKDTLLARAAFVSLHTPLNMETHHMISHQELKAMKSTAVLVNTARGGIVDEQALCEALASGDIAGAALDVFEQEPVSFDNPLLKLPNVLCSPHVAGQTEESMVRMSIAAAENILRVFRGERPSFIVNPEVLGNHTRISWKTTTHSANKNLQQEGNNQ